MYFVYILFSATKDKYYVDSCQNLKDRLTRHNGGRSKSTKSGAPWIIVYVETFSARSGAYQQEIEIKKRKSRKYIENLVITYKSPAGSEHPDL